jgi:predicted metal-dependent phosphotriesterase family hydrolase
MARCHELLRGAIDLHTHSAPSLFDRLLDDVGLAAQAPDAGMRAVLPLCPEQGISDAEIRTMVAENPARLLGLA